MANPPVRQLRSRSSPASARNRTFITNRWLTAVKPLAEKSFLVSVPSVTDMSIAAWPSIEPRKPFAACVVASATRREVRKERKSSPMIVIMITPPTNSAAANCRLAERGVNPPTLQKCRDHLVSALGQAVKERTWGIEVNVAATVDAPADPDAPSADDWYTLTAAQADALLAQLAGDEYESLYEICLRLGLRQSEALGLTWADVDLEKGAISIRQSLAGIRATDIEKAVRNGVMKLKRGQTVSDLGRLVALEPKTKHSKSSLPLTTTGVRLLRVHYRGELEKMIKAGTVWQGGDPREKRGYVWTTELGTPISASNFVRRHFHPLCERAGIPTGPQPDGRRGFRFHDMRHSTASIMAARGERPEVIQRVMRHAKVSFTIDRYVKVYRDDVREAVQRNDRQAAAR